MARGLIDMIIDSIFDEEWQGRRGEKLTERELKLVRLLGRKGKTLRNIYIPKDNGETSEIDVVYITQKGIFVFESKNYSGWIFGNEKGTYWTVVLPNKQKNRFYNPVKQNRTHIKWLQKYVGEDVPLFSIIVFSERCELKKVEIESADVKVIKRDRTYAAVRDIWDSHEDAVENIDALYEQLKSLTNVDAAVKAAHIADIEIKYKNPETKAKVWAPVNEPEDSSQEDISVFVSEPVPESQPISTTVSAAPTEKESNSPICPWCGKALILRTAKKGTNVGKQFYGCSGFPKCRYVKNL